jgi:LAS superfamily LD-carboxypeptidase LdcB
MFNGVKWYKKDPKLASLAAPGTSQHNLGIAVDVHTASETKRLKWLIDNVKTFGFSWEVVPEEPWHIRYVSGDDVPAAVREYMDVNKIESPK